ncbi:MULTISPECIES: cytochrome c-type biogenesis protein CcmH [Pseudovibrio]|uniref:cytochrome c-type biogenesis protein n=1 Tax=Stappiaceae TaxID=2821832 RepID=UPI00236713CA|nr:MULTISPECIES: cytochrome c-type biogenesis protein [Pseudovibrio]MDD7909126.1 cytochrome c-type biogenesis protein CcmH [Pseudovibrio exalbescens]MDX5595570.1 cytochrome c-type biogenesis protein [Pseudovibrio sp. SPO723]
MKILLRTLAVLAVLATPSWAVNPDEVLDDPALEQRARDLSAEIRCVVCQNQSIDDSNAQLAKDLRLLVRERLQEGDSDEEVLNYLVDRYGEFVLMKPRFAPHTWLLWAGGPLILLVGGAVIFFSLRKRRKLLEKEIVPPPLSKKEKEELEALFKEE